MKGQNIKKYQQKEVNLMSKLIRKQEIILFLCCVTKWPMEAEKIEYVKWVIIDFGGQIEAK